MVRPGSSVFRKISSLFILYFGLSIFLLAPTSASPYEERYDLFKAQRLHSVITDKVTSEASRVAYLWAAGGGQYALYLAKKMPRGSTMFIIDPFEDPKNYIGLLNRIQVNNLQVRVHLLRAELEDAAEMMREEKFIFDLIIWDGDDDHANLGALEKWWGLIKGGGALVGDDYRSAHIVQMANSLSKKVEIPIKPTKIWKDRQFKFWELRRSNRIDFDLSPLLARPTPRVAIKIDQLKEFSLPFRFACEVMKGLADDLGIMHEDRIIEFEKLTRWIVRSIEDPSKAESQPSIPLVHHRIWLTDISNPIDPSKLTHSDGSNFLDYYIKSLDVMKGSNWTHVLWCLDPEYMAGTIEVLGKLGVEVRSIYDSKWGIYSKMPSKHLFDAFLADRHYSLAGNLLREWLIASTGGFYADMSIELLLDPILYLTYCDAFYAGRKYRVPGQKDFHYLDHDVTAGVKGSPIHTQVTENLSNLFDPENQLAIRGNAHFPDPSRQVEFTRPPMLMLAVSQVLRQLGGDPERLKLLWGNDHPGYRRHGNHSWYHGKFGSAKAAESAVNIFEVAPPPYYDWISRAHIMSILNIPVLSLHLAFDPKGPSKIHQEYKEGIYRRRSEVYKNTIRGLLSLKTDLSSEPEREGLVGKLFHRVWLTDQDNPTEVPAEFLTAFRESMERQEEDAISYFWCQDPEKIPDTIKTFQDFPRRVEVKIIGRDLTNFSAIWLYDFYIKRKIWALAGDIVRHFIIGAYGGLYTDAGMLLRENMAPYMRKFDLIIANREKWLDMCVLGAKKNDPSHTLFLDYLANIKERVPENLQNEGLWGNLHLHNSHGLAAWIDSLDPEQVSLLLLPDNSLIKKNGLNSWRKEDSRYGGTINKFPSVEGESNNFFDL